MQLIPEEVDSRVKRAKSKSDEHALIASNLKDRNDLVDKLFSNSHHIKSIYFNDEDEFTGSFNFIQDEYYDKIIAKFNDTNQ